jgi:toxin FitB
VQATGELVVPTISLYEVFKSILRQRGEGPALQVAALMCQGRVADLTTDLALAAAQISLAHGIPMADSIMLATARAHDALLWSQDADFHGIEGVRYVERKPRAG